jgi:hypothetical protein
MTILIYLTPFIPLSFKGEGEGNRRGANAPLKHPLGRVKERRSLSYKSSFPFPLTRGRGYRG